MAIEKYHLGERVAAVLEKRGMTKAEFARRIFTSRQNVNALLNREDLCVWQLAHMGEVLEHNFFAELARQIPKGKPSPLPDPQPEPPAQQGAELLVRFQRPPQTRITQAIHCLEAYFGPGSVNWESESPPLIFKGIYQWLGAP